MKEIYKDYEIEYMEFTNEFRALIGKSTYSNKELAKVRKHIDNLDKKEFKRVSVFVNDWRKSFKTVTVTSEFKERRDLFAWVVDNNKSRSKESLNNLFSDIPENRDKIQTVKEMKEKITALEIAVQETISSMEKYKPQTKASDEQEQP